MDGEGKVRLHWLILSGCHRYHISFSHQHTARDPQDDLFKHPSEGDLQSLFHQVLLMLEETNYCDFEVRLSSSLFQCFSHLFHLYFIVWGVLYC